ncbi:MAG TPA: hypothetical protein PK280_06270 [Planctomycetota bacterium]|nr:hypothetical protein [Planctomycetota bacterium]
MTKKRLGELLRDEGLVNEAQIEEALADQRKSGELLGEVLVRLGYVTEADIAQTIVTQFGLPYIAVKQYFLSDDVIKLFPERLMRQHQFIPLDRIGRVITIAVGGLLNFDVLTELENMATARIQVFVSTWSEIKAAIDDRFKGSAKPKAKGQTQVSAPPPPGPAPAAQAPAAAEGEDSTLTELGNMLLGDVGGGPEPQK